MTYFSGFCLHDEEALFERFLMRNDFCVAGFSYGAIKALNYALTSQKRIDTLQQPLAHYEKIKRFTLLPHHFSIENGEMTNTLKIKRNVVAKRYKDVIDAMYED